MTSVQRIGTIIIIVVVILILAVIATINDEPTLPAPVTIGDTGLASVSWRKGGGMDGGHDEITLTVEPEKNRVVITTDRLDHYGAKEVKKTTTADESVVREVEGLIAAYALPDCAALPLSDIQVLDAPTESFTIAYHDGRSYHISGEQALSDRDLEGITAVRNAMRKAVGADD